MTGDPPTVVVVDDERPARAFLAATVRTIAEAELDLHMPESVP